MFRACAQRLPLKRPAGTRTEISSNRFLEDKWFQTATELFLRPPYPYKPVKHNWRYFLYPGKATNGPPLGQHFSGEDLKAMDFTKAFNDHTKGKFKDDVPLQIRVQVYMDKTYTWRIEPPPKQWFLMRCVRKKRRETGPLEKKNMYSAYMTLEMLYECAKARGHWIDSARSKNWPPIEVRVRELAREAQRMGICIIGVDTHDSPVKGPTQAEYEKQSAEYRKKQWELYVEYKQKVLEEEGGLYARYHRPNLSNVKREVLEKSIVSPELMAQLWENTHPSRLMRYRLNEKMPDSVAAALDSFEDFRGGANDLTAEELKAIVYNWKMPALEVMRQARGVEEPYQINWGDPDRDDLANVAK